MYRKNGLSCEKDRLDAALELREGWLEFIVRRDQHRNNLDLQPTRGDLRHIPIQLPHFVPRMPQAAHALQVRDQLLEEIELLFRHIRTHIGDAGHMPPGWDRLATSPAPSGS